MITVCRVEFNGDKPDRYPNNPVCDCRHSNFDDWFISNCFVENIFFHVCIILKEKCATLLKKLKTPSA